METDGFAVKRTKNTQKLNNKRCAWTRCPSFVCFPHVRHSLSSVSYVTADQVLNGIRHSRVPMRSGLLSLFVPSPDRCWSSRRPHVKRSTMTNPALFVVFLAVLVSHGAQCLSFFHFVLDPPPVTNTATMARYIVHNSGTWFDFYSLPLYGRHGISPQSSPAPDKTGRGVLVWPGKVFFVFWQWQFYVPFI